jgi:hypothetical protein
VGALRDNKGLVDSDLRHYTGVSDETWATICDSLETHPTLEVLRTYEDLHTLHPAVIKFRVEALLEMMKVNTSLHTLRVDYCYRGDELFRESVIAYLRTNRFRLHVRAIQKTRPIPYRAKVLGRALLSARTNSNRFWMLLSGNAEVALFPSTTPPAVYLPTLATNAEVALFPSTTTPAVNLPTPATNAEVALFPSTTTPAVNLPTPAACSFCCRFFYCKCCWCRRYSSH